MNELERVERLPTPTRDQIIDTMVRHAIWRHTGKFPYKPQHWLFRYLRCQAHGNERTFRWKGEAVLRITEHSRVRDLSYDDYCVEIGKELRFEYLGKQKEIQ